MWSRWSHSQCNACLAWHLVVMSRITPLKLQALNKMLKSVFVLIHHVWAVERQTEEIIPFLKQQIYTETPSVSASCLSCYCSFTHTHFSVLPSIRRYPISVTEPAFDFLLSLISPFPVCHTLWNVCLCAFVSLPRWDSHDQGRWVREKDSQSEMCHSPFPLRMASVPQQCDQGCQRNCTNPSADILIALCLHRLLATYIKLNLALPPSVQTAESRDTFHQMENESCVWPGWLL